MCTLRQTFFNFLKRVCNSSLFTWVVLFLPAIPMLEDRYYPELMWESGVFAAQLTVVTLALTPLQYLFKEWQPGLSFVRWFVKRRRYIGIAAFGYSALHTYFYIVYTGSLEFVLLDLLEVDLLLGWIAMAVMFVLALTSNNQSQRLLGKNWKTIQRLTYVSAVATALHWVLINQFIDILLAWALPLIVLQCFRVYQRRHVLKHKYCP